MTLSSFAGTFKVHLFFWLEFSPRLLGCARLRWLFRIEPNFYEINKSWVGIKCKGDKVKKVIKILIGEDPIMNTLKFTVKINSPFKSTDFGPISIWSNKLVDLYLPFLLHVQHIEQIIDHSLSLQIHVSLYPIY